MDTYKKVLIEVMADVIDGAISDDRLISIVSRLKLKFKDDADLVNALEDTMVCAFQRKRESGSKLSPCATVILNSHRAPVKSWLTQEQIASLQTTMPMSKSNMTIPKDDKCIACNHMWNGGCFATIINEAGTEYTCTICGAKFAPQMPNDAEIDKSIRVFSDIINLAKLCFPKEEYVEPFSYIIPMMKKLRNIKAIVERKINYLSFSGLVQTKSNTTDPIPTTSTIDSKESNLKGGDATRKEATTMATTNTTTEAGELIANFTKNSLGDKLPKEYFVSTGIVEAIPVLSKAVNSAMEIALIRAIITGEYPQLLKLSQGETLANARELVRALSNKNDNEVGITDLIKILQFGSYDCQIDKEGRIAATLLYNNLYK